MNPEQPFNNEKEKREISRSEYPLEDFQLIFKKNPEQLGVVDVMDKIEKLTQNAGDNNPEQNDLIDRVNELLYSVGYVRPDMVEVLEETVGEHLQDWAIKALKDGEIDSEK